MIRTAFTFGRARFGVLLVAAVVLGFAGLAQTPAGHALAAKAGLSASPPRYTELSFTHPRRLPASFAATETSTTVAFSIVNHDDKARTYSWHVRAGSTPARAVELAAAQVRVPARATAVITRAVHVACAGKRTRVSVALAAPGSEEIAFWASCANGAAR
jgi:hypothetical protein